MYLSPVTEAVPGSTHGYDVTDHTRVRDELGGLDGLTALLDALAGRGMGALVDHVPNHVAVGAGRAQPALVGDAARRARQRGGALVRRRLGGGRRPGHPARCSVSRWTTSSGASRSSDGELRLGPQRFPLAPGTEALAPAEALARQHYRLQWWRDPARNVRRFFTIDDLVGVRVEDPDVAAVVDTVPRLLADHEAFAGVRVDHVDGLADPLGYLDRLRARDRRPLARRREDPRRRTRRCRARWPVEGTTGYEHAAVLEHALLDRDGWRPAASRVGRARRRTAARSGRGSSTARREVLHGRAAPRPRAGRARAAAAASTCPPTTTARRGVETLSVHLGRYRTYLPDEEGRPALEAAVAARLGGPARSRR